MMPMLEAVDAAELARALAPLAPRFAEIRVFGSRATGRARRTSDLDLVVYGAEPETIDAVVDALDESLLPMTADVVRYEDITSDLLREHIARFSVPLPLSPGCNTLMRKGGACTA